MKKILLIFLLLLLSITSPQIYSQVSQLSPNVDTVRTIVGNPDDGGGTGEDLPPGIFKPPFKCGLTYYGATYSTHSRYSVDFNRLGYNDQGDPVLASANGRVVEYLPSNGQVKIRHVGGYYTWYVHMRNVRVRVGDVVKLGQQIGEISNVGNAKGSHLHVNHARGTADGTQIQIAYDGVPYRASVLSPPPYSGPGVKGWCPPAAAPAPTPNPGGGTNPAAAPPCNMVAARLKSDFRITIQSGGSPNFPGKKLSGELIDCSGYQKFYQAWATLAKSPAFNSRLKSGSATVQLFLPDSSMPLVNGGHLGYTPSSSSMQLINGVRFIKSSYSAAALWIAHETGHLVNARSGYQLERNFPLDDLRKSATDGDCYDSIAPGRYFLRSYALRSTRPKSESLAEAIALYVYNDKATNQNPANNEFGRSIYNFKSTCPATYNWVKENVFNNYEYR